MGRYQSDDDLSAVSEAIEADESEREGTDEAAEESEDQTDAAEVGEETPAETEGEPEEQDSAEAEDDPTFTVMVDGVETEVPLSELSKGYMRTADYTRKTQLLASQRRQLEDANQLMVALERNPQATLQVLARHFGVEDYEPEPGDTGPTPEQIRLAQLEQWAQSEAARQREAAVDAQLVSLHQQYGDFDEEALFTFAVERGVQDLETALRAMNFGHVAATRRTEKRSMAAVAGGSGRNGTAKPKAPPERINVFQDAYEAAKRELEMGN